MVKEMKITLAMVLSVDGKSTKWDLPDQSWASAEDKNHLIKTISENNLILMGGNTYSIAKNHIKPKEGKLRIVLTRNPSKYSENQVPGQLEFTNEPIDELLRRLKETGYEKMLLLSGEKLNYEFLSKNLVDEIVLTIEPKIFGTGKSLASGGGLDINLELINYEKLNDSGTLLLTYRVLQK